MRPRPMALLATVLTPLMAALTLGLATPALAGPPALSAGSTGSLDTTGVGGEPAGSAPRLRAASWSAAQPGGLMDSDGATKYHVDYRLQGDGSAWVTTDITWQFPPGEQRHGIFLDIPTAQAYGDRTDVYRRYAVSDVTVSSPSGAPDQVSQIDQDSVTRLRIGSADQYVQHAQEEYHVTYRLGAVMNETAGGQSAEFYFNAIAPDKDAPFHGVQITAQAPAPSTRVRCFYGEQGSTTTCDAKSGAVATFTPTDAQADAGVTVLAEYPRTAFGPSIAPDLADGRLDSDGDVAPATVPFLETGAYLGGVLLPLLMAGLMGVLVWRRGRDERFAGLTPGLTPAPGQDTSVVRGGRQPVVVQFTPPAGVQPGLVGTIIDERADTLDVSATVVDLAVRGYLRMEEATRPRSRRHDWLLTRTSPQQPGPQLTDYEATLLEGLFAQGDPIYLSELRNHFRSTLDLTKQSMYSETIRRGWFRQSPEATRARFVALGSLLMLAGGGVFFLAVFTPMLAVLGPGAGLVLAVGLFLAGVIVAALGRRMAAKTAQGSAVHAQSLGFRRYLETAEANQIRFEEAEQIFSRYLPYAIVFGVAERWAKVFREVAEAALAQGTPITMPMWYGGVGYGDFGSVASGMDDFATSAAGVFTSTPGSSGGSGFSSGGGFSGGGGGGGGASGGSW